VLVCAVTVCGVVFVTVAGLLAIELVHPDTDTTAGLSAAWDATAVLAGAVLGYLIGVRLKNGDRR